jgi:hypothetical protein
MYALSDLHLPRDRDGTPLAQSTAVVGARIADEARGPSAPATCAGEVCTNSKIWEWHSDLAPLVTF